MSNEQSTPASRLAAILTEENAALAALDFPRAAMLLSAKTQAAEAFRVAQATWPDPAEVAALLSELAAENRRLLQCAMDVQGRVIEIVARAIPRALQRSAPCYGAQGRLPAPRVPPVTVSARA
jgi:hypothetical protein